MDNNNQNSVNSGNVEVDRKERFAYVWIELDSSSKVSLCFRVPTGVVQSVSGGHSSGDAVRLQFGGSYQIIGGFAVTQSPRKKLTCISLTSDGDIFSLLRYV